MNKILIHKQQTGAENLPFIIIAQDVIIFSEYEDLKQCLYSLQKAQVNIFVWVRANFLD